jgi:hypothetical protein
MLGVPDYHPEFGLLCPSPRRRRGVRLAVLCIATTLAIGATMGLAVAHWSANGEGPAATAEPLNASPLARVSATGVAPAPEHKSCKPDKVDTITDLVGLFLAPDCGSSKHARHGARAASRVANVVIGRTDTVPTPAAATLAEPVEVKTADSEKPATPAADERTKPLKKRKAKANGPIAITPPAGTTFNPYSAPSFGREAYDPYRNSYRAAAQPGFASSFGRSW